MAPTTRTLEDRPALWAMALLAASITFAAVSVFLLAVF